MIEINLLPGSDRRKKRPTGGGFALKLPESTGGFDRMKAFILAAWIIGPLLAGWLYFGVRSDRTDVQNQLDVALADSARYARLIDAQASLQARQDTIAQKLVMIQEIDAGRYIWAHVMDEVSRALPPYTWLTSIYQMEGGTAPQFGLEGRTGNLPALTRFMDALEASPFLRNVQLVSSEQARSDDDRVVNNFVLTGSYEQPPVELIETVPLFEDAAAGSAADEGPEASDGTGAS